MVLGEECANPKPYPDPYQEGLKAFGVKPEETIVCEDSPSGELQSQQLCSCQQLERSEQHSRHNGTQCGHCSQGAWWPAGPRGRGHLSYAALNGCSPCSRAPVSYSDGGFLHAGTAAGVAAGIAVVGVLTSQTKTRMEKAGVSLTIKDYDELVAKAKADEAKHSNGKA